MSVALLSLRDVRQVPWFGGIVDSEDVLHRCLDAALHRVTLTSRAFEVGPLGGAQVRRALGWTGVVRPYGIRFDERRGRERADVLVVMVNDLHDAAMLLGIRGWSELGDVVIMQLAEVNDRDLRLYPEVLRHLRRTVDHVIVGIVTPALRPGGRVRTVVNLPPPIDVLAFPERPSAAERPIGVLNIGRRDPGQHRLLLEWAREHDGMYLFDSGYIPSVGSLAEHRRLITQNASRSRVFITNQAAVGDARRGFRTPQIGLRFYEAMAAGCVLAGALPTAAPHYASVEAARPVVLPLDPHELPAELTTVLTDDSEQESRGRAARRSALMHVDAAHRWDEIARRTGVPTGDGIRERLDLLGAKADLLLPEA